MIQTYATTYTILDDDRKMAADVFGAGPAIILIHGIPGGPAAWHQAAVALGRTYRVVVPHLLGFAGSTRPTTPEELWADAQAGAVLRLCDQLGLQSAALVGHDFGGPVAAKLIERRPPFWTHLALFSTNTFGDTPVPPPLSFAVLPVAGRVFQRLLFSRPALAMMLRQGVGRPGISLSRATYLGDGQQVRAIATIFAYALTHLDTLYPPIERALAAYRGPALVGWGDRDPFFSAEQGRRTAALVGGAFSLYSGAGHFTPEECAHEIVADLSRLLARNGASTVTT